MKTILHSFLKWAKDPFGKKDITKHSTYIHHIHETEEVTRRTTEKITKTHRRRTTPYRYGGVGIIDKTVLGTHRRVRKQV